MSTLQFIVGGAGSGKSTRLFSYIHEKAKKEPERSFLVIVPEQFTLQTQKALVEMQENRAIMNIDVLSFQRLAFRVFDDLGKNDFLVLEENGKNLVLRRVAQSLSSEMTVLSGSLRKMGFIQEMKSLISELMQYRILAEDLDFLAEKEKGTYFSDKLKDVARLLRGFSDYIRGKAVTAEGILELLIEVAGESELIRDSVIVLDAFTGFTPIQLALLKKLLPLVSEVKVAVTADAAAPLLRDQAEDSLFSMSSRMVKALTFLAKETGAEILAPEELPSPEKARFKTSPEMAHLEKNLFRKSPAAFLKETDRIRVVAAQTPYEELVFAASEIRRLVRLEGLRYKEIAVLSADLPSYAAHAKEVFESFRIPVYVDQNEAIRFHPLTEGIEGILRILKEDYSTESVFHFLRTGLLPLEREEVDRLETYALSHGLRGRRMWEKPMEEEGETLSFDGIRQSLLTEMKPFEEAFLKKERTALEQCRVFYDFLIRCGAEKKMEELANRQEAEGEKRRARESEKIYEIVIEFLDKTAEILGEENLNAGEFLELFQAALECAKVGSLPEGYDRVIIGDMERSRFGEIKVLLILGVNDGVIPKTTGTGGLLSEPERTVFADHGFSLSPSPRERAFIQRFYLYMNTVKPSERLVLSWSALDREGTARKRSYFVSTVLSLFPWVKEETPAMLPETPESALALLVGMLREERKGEEEKALLPLAAWYRGNPKWSRRLEPLYHAAFLSRGGELLPRELTHKLYGETLTAGVTRLECFALCPAKHFLQYGLGLRERDLHEFGAPDLGSLFHEALSAYGKDLTSQGLSWEEALASKDRLLSKALDAASAVYRNAGFFSDPRGEFELSHLRELLDRTVDALTFQLAAGDYRPAAYELPFGGEENASRFPLTGGTALNMVGRIDRVDVGLRDRDLFFKVLDYKTGQAKLTVNDLLYGLSLQLPLYAFVTQRLLSGRYPGKRIRPGGLLYYQVKDPLIEEDGTLPEKEQREAYYKLLQPDGLMNEGDEALACFDRAFSEAQAGVSSLVIPVRKKADGGFYANTPVMSEEELSSILSYTEKKIVTLGEEIYRGAYLPSPIKSKTKDGCAYCRYRSVCGFDERVPGYSYRRLKETEETEAMAEIRKALEVHT
ncbi:MAG: PD-(D/E)XK nuclease family protein [Lachnospiraceae bacterium]|nr:PD-(D/E)XK nuclease family protein [Lachnospiraceae bacterium]